MKSIALFLALFTFYLLLSGQFENEFLMQAGIVMSFGISALCLYMGILDDEGMPIRFWLKTALYVPWLMWQIILSNIDVAKRVWNPKLPISPQLVFVPHQLKTSYGISTYANSITLTPGTITVTIEKDGFLVHALTQQAIDDLLGGEMHRRVQHIEDGKAP